MFSAQRFFDDKRIFYKESQGGHGHEARIDCPLCSGKKGKSLSVNLESGATTCYRCGWSPSAEEFIRTILDCTHFEAEVLARRYFKQDQQRSAREEFDRVLENGFDVDPYSDKSWGPGQQQHMNNIQEGKKTDKKRDGEKLELPGNWYPLEDPRVTTVRKYALSRGFPMELYQELGFGGCVKSKYGGCLIMSAYHGDELVFWQARDALKREEFPKYRTPPGWSPSEALFNLDVAVTHEEVILCEGIFSALRVGRDAVATFGNKVSSQQIELLRERGVRRVVLCFDPDTWSIPEEAQKRGFTQMRKPVEVAFEKVVSSFERVRVVRLEGSKDPDDTGTERMRELIVAAPVLGSMLEFYGRFFDVF